MIVIVPLTIPVRHSGLTGMVYLTSIPRQGRQG